GHHWSVSIWGPIFLTFSLSWKIYSRSMRTNCAARRTPSQCYPIRCDSAEYGQSVPEMRVRASPTRRDKPACLALSSSLRLPRNRSWNECERSAQNCYLCRTKLHGKHWRNANFPAPREHSYIHSTTTILSPAMEQWLWRFWRTPPKWPR